MTGYKKSNNHCKNISIALTGKTASKDRVDKMRNTVTLFHVNQYDINGVFIKKHFSSYDASKELNIPIKNIQRVCRGLYHSTYNLKFTYEPRTSI